jgi:hypothetical protein
MERRDKRVGYARFASVVFIRNSATKQLLGGKFVGRELLMALGWKFFEAGALLALKYRDSLDAFLPPFAGVLDENTKSLLEQAGASVARVEAAADGTLDLFYMHEMRVSRSQLPTSQWRDWIEQVEREREREGTASDCVDAWVSLPLARRRLLGTVAKSLDGA